MSSNVNIVCGSMSFYGYNAFSSIFLLPTQSRFYAALVKWHDIINCVHSSAFTVHGTFPIYSTVTQCQLVTKCGYNLTIMPFVYIGHILHTAVTNLQCVSILCSLWDFVKFLLVNRRKIFATFVDTALLNSGINQIIF